VRILWALEFGVSESGGKGESGKGRKGEPGSEWW